MSEREVLVLGSSGAGKTHYAGQLLGRMRYNRYGKLRLNVGGVEDLARLEEVLACLEEGRAAGHTPADTWDGIKYKLSTEAGDQVFLEWPEYAGERLFNVVEQRVLPKEWRELVHRANGWLLFIRLSTLKQYEDLLGRPIGDANRNSAVSTLPVLESGWDEQVKYVELLQMLQFAADRSNFLPFKRPKLAVALSCWDELPSSGLTPEDVFRKRAPLLHMFLSTNWQAKSWSVWGVSSLGQSLNQTECDEEFAMSGPENFGYVVPPGSTEAHADLTQPVEWLIRKDNG